MWRELFAHNYPNVKLILVSDYLRKEIEAVLLPQLVSAKEAGLVYSDRPTDGSVAEQKEWFWAYDNATLEDRLYFVRQMQTTEIRKWTCLIRWTWDAKITSRLDRRSDVRSADDVGSKNSHSTDRVTDARR